MPEYKNWKSFAEQIYNLFQPYFITSIYSIIFRHFMFCVTALIYNLTHIPKYSNCPFVHWYAWYKSISSIGYHKSKLGRMHLTRYKSIFISDALNYSYNLYVLQIYNTLIFYSPSKVLTDNTFVSSIFYSPPFNYIFGALKWFKLGIITRKLYGKRDCQIVSIQKLLNKSYIQ